MQLPKNRNRDLRLNRFHYVAINSPLILNMSVLQVDVAARKNPLKHKRETTVCVNMVMKREVTQLSPRNEAKQNKRVNNSNNNQKRESFYLTGFTCLRCSLILRTENSLPAQTDSTKAKRLRLTLDFGFLRTNPLYQPETQNMSFILMGGLMCLSAELSSGKSFLWTKLLFKKHGQRFN